MEQSLDKEHSEAKIMLSKKDVTKSFWRWTFFSHANYNYERLEATGLVHALSPIIKKLYADDPQEYRNALKRHMAFFNTEPHFGGVICGMVIAMEEDRANGAPITDDAINGIKTGLMGPFAGIGDTLWQGTLTPILLAFGVSLGAEGNLLGPIVYGLLMFGLMFSLSYFVWMQGYRMGKSGIEKILSSNILQYLITGASAMGAIVLGALTANFVSVSSPFVISVGSVELGLQEDILDKLFKGILPLSITLLTLYLLKNRKMKSTMVMLILVAIGVAFGALNIL